MSYTKNQRVRHTHGQLGTVTQDAPDHAVVSVRWDGSDRDEQVLPECVQPLDKQQATSVSVREAWTRERTVAR